MTNAVARPDVRDYISDLKQDLIDIAESDLTPKDCDYIPEDYPEIHAAIKAVVSAFGIPYEESETATFSVKVDRSEGFAAYARGPAIVSSNGNPAIFWAGTVTEFSGDTPLAGDVFGFKKNDDEAGVAFYDPKGYCWPFPCIMSEDGKKADAMRMSYFADLVPHLSDFTPITSLREKSDGTEILISELIEKQGKRGPYSVMSCSAENVTFLAYNIFGDEPPALPVVGVMAEEGKVFLVADPNGKGDPIRYEIRGSFQFKDLKDLVDGESYKVIKLALVPGNPNGKEVWMREPKWQGTILDHLDGNSELRIDLKTAALKRRFAKMPDSDVVTFEDPATLEIRGRSTTGNGRTSVTCRFLHSSLEDKSSGLERLKNKAFGGNETGETAKISSVSAPLLATAPASTPVAPATAPASTPVAVDIPEGDDDLPLKLPTAPAPVGTGANSLVI